MGRGGNASREASKRHGILTRHVAQDLARGKRDDVSRVAGHQRAHDTPAGNRNCSPAAHACSPWRRYLSRKRTHWVPSTESQPIDAA
jgi:hypothetical protein